MALTLFVGSGSPFSWRAWLGMEHKQLPHELRMLSFQAGEVHNPEHLARNPRGKVPVLDDDGFTLYESTAILYYLERRFPDRPLFPTSIQGRAIADRMLAEVNGYISYANSKFANELNFKKEPDEKTLASGLDDWKWELDLWAKQMRGDYLAGDEVGGVDYAMYPLLALSLRAEQRKRPGYGLAAAVPPAIQAWQKRIEALPYFDKCYPPHWKQK